ncbi:MAG: TonB family protein [Geobacter sp.]|nr:TonB family protein [Geobacter sp.]
MSSDQYVEKTFLYLLLISIVLHVAGFAALYFWPKKQQQQISEPTFIDLQDMPELKTPSPQQEQQKALPSDKRRRVAKESAPRQTVPVAPTPKAPPARQSARVKPSAVPGRPGPAGPPAKPSEAGSSVNELLRRKPQQQAGTGGGGGGTRPQPNLAPSASRMARLEENYRRRFADDLDDGTTRFLNTDDIQFGSFLRRFETAVYGVWRYPQEAALKGIEGVTPVKITFNRNGEIKKIQLLESSGSRVLDDEVFRTLRLIGPMGNFPKNYGKDEFHLIAFFQYGNARGRLR